MPEIDIRNTSGKTVGTVMLPDEVFAAPVKRHLLHEAVRNYRNTARRGTHDTKNRVEIAGGGKKPWKQKHTGRARHGSTRSPLWRSGGTVHGPTPRDYGYSLPKEVRRGALRSALSLRTQGERLIVLDALELTSPKSKELMAMIEGPLGLSKKVLIVHDGAEGHLTLAARNLEKVKVVRTLGVNVYDILNHHFLVLTKGAALKIGEVLAK